MKCQEAISCLHEYLDGRLSTPESAPLFRHLESCPACSDLLADLSILRTTLSVREEMPQQMSDQLWAHIDSRLHWSVTKSACQLWDTIRTFCRDLDNLFVWSRVSAAPITLGFFVILLMQFSQVELYQLSYPVFEIKPSLSSVQSMSETQAAQQRSVITGLTDTVWRIPYEDSLSLVAEITPEGRAVIENVLEYPRSTDLLDAVDQTLQESRFETAANLKGSFVLFSLQKIDVYER